MPLMYTFCTWLPLRLGTIIVGLISIIQSTIIEMVCILSLSMTDTISREINKMLHSNNMIYTTEILKAVEKDPRNYITNIMIYFILHTISCVALIYGAFKSSIKLILPYIILEFIRLFIIFYLVITSMVLIKINVLDFLFLIFISVIGIILLQILIYLWCCPLSLVQCLILNKKLLGSQSRESFESNNNALPKTAVNNQDVVYDPLSDHYGWRPFKPSYSYPYENMPQYEY
ncbi:uncharacterized protein LOC112599112 [Melanaphis sacchari]|uniref:uncharacterized protein LOC112599112 n=1 Tax=Melanaphis sacchari TaxID=742174 RepID=UPI000DC15806|nr:uncharacterized protein LOC112599112 [Melanaphis sacchari]